MSTTVHLEVFLKPDADPAEVDRIEREVLAQTRAYAGNEGIEVIVDDSDPTKAIVVEKWESPEAHDAYVAWRATPDGANELVKLMAAVPVTRVFSTTITL
ncbi:monooxygenase [Frondihabitans sp. PAMC 28766]|uniref:putative quinol monooxygenase n=1 Tax=Frondihabitans sp. PAMC 28766 TaxID=1795630 RepID=UPI00078C51E1|nr:antibiotic biosynthesis monooxygenase family protein [Frondihabitans sp. PAMC 28766]AMM18829.1 monooxygenase [Frondihabitans sp. PAMC 28766]